MKHLTAAALAACLTLGAATALASPATPWMSAVDTVRADGELIWTIDYQLHNPLETGFFPDSFFADFEDRDGAAMRSPRRFTERLDAFLKGILPLSGGDSIGVSYMPPMRFEKGQVTLRMYGHTAATSGALPALTSTTQLLPGPYNAAYPSVKAPAGKGKVELVLIAPGNSEGKAPGILYVHDERTHARRALSTARYFQQHGYAVALVNMPGYGASSGPADWCGPATVAALEIALKKLAHLPGVDPARLAVWGQSRGATAAALLAARHPELKALALEGATYDLAAAWRAGSPEARAEIFAEAGRDSTKWKSRSPLASARLIRCPVVLLHGEDDAIAPTASAHAFEAAVRAAGTEIEPHYFAQRGHELPPGSVRSSCMVFLRKRLGN